MSGSILRSDSAAPLYSQLMRRIRADIAAGVYPPDTRIPTENALCAEYGVSRVTVRRALAELAREGLLEPHQGKGTYVTVPRVSRDLRSVNSFSDSCRRSGAAVSTSVLRAGWTEADGMDRGVGLTGRAVEIVRLRCMDGVPVMEEDNHFPPAYGWLLDEDLTGSLYALLRGRGIEPSQAAHEISLCRADAEEAERLAVAERDALMRLDEVIYDQDGNLLHTSRQKIRGDRFTFRI